MAVIDLNYYAETATLSRTVAPYEKFRVRTADGRIRREVAGSYITYSLALGNVDKAKYDELMALLLSVDEYATVIMPHGADSRDNITFDAVFDSVTDELITEEGDGGRYWDNLTIQLVMAQPVSEVV